MESKYYKWIGAFVVVGILAIIVYLLTRGDPVADATQTSNETPEIFITKVSKVINPYKPVETYVEYAVGDTGVSDTDLSRQVHIQFNWNNRGGFEGLSAIRLVREVSTDGSPRTVLEDILINNPGDTGGTNAMYFTSFVDASYTFKVIPNGLTAVGTNYITMYYYYEPGLTNTNKPAITTSSRRLNMDDVVVPVKRSDIILTLSITSTIVVDFTPGGTSFTENRRFLGEGYFLHPNNTTDYSLQSTIGLAYVDYKIIFTPTDTANSDTTTVEMKLMSPNGNIKIPLWVDNDYLVPWTGISGTKPTSNFTFNLVKNAKLTPTSIAATGNQGVYKIRSATATDKYVTIFSTTGGLKPYMRSTADVNHTTATWNSMDMFFYKQNNTTNAPCEYSSASTPCREENTRGPSCNGRSLLRGEKCTTYTVNKSATGTGSCLVTNGQEAIEQCYVNCTYTATGQAKEGESCKKCWKTESDKTVGQKYTKLDAVNGSCTAKEPTDTLSCDNKACTDCPVNDAVGACVFNMDTGKGSKYHTYTYNTTGDNEGCYEQNKPSDGLRNDSTCPNARPCTVTKVSGNCNGSNREYTYVKSNPDILNAAACPIQPANGSEYDAVCEYETKYGLVRCVDFTGQSDNDFHNALNNAAGCDCSWDGETNDCSEDYGTVNVLCSDYGYTAASGGTCG